MKRGDFDHDVYVPSPGRLLPGDARGGGNDAGIIQKMEVLGGCSGNLQGISALVVGMPAQEAIHRLKGIRCGAKSTSCPDQFACGLESALAKQK